MSPLSLNEDVSFLQGRIPVMIFFVLAFCLLVVARLFYLQIYRGESYRHLSSQTSIREEEIRAKRGDILDRNGTVLATTRPYYEVVAVPQYLSNPGRTIASLSSLVPLSPRELLEKFEHSKNLPPFQPVVLIDDAPYSWIASIRQRMRPEYNADSPLYLEGIEVRRSLLRTYLYPSLFSHVLGYLKEIDSETLKTLRDRHEGRYSMGDLMGASGVEATYDLELRGIDGMRARVVDARGREIRHEEMDLLADEASMMPRPGKNLKTSLDLAAQLAAEEAMAGRKGAVVALDPNQGEVLALYSSPGFDPNRITKTIDADYWKTINLHEDKFLFNRAVQGTYPPGSIYKIVGAFAGLDSGNITPQSRFRCGGGLHFGSRFFRCWRSGGHGTVELLRGLYQSCDVFFYNVGLKVGVDSLYHYARLFGLDQKTGIDIPFEQSGLIPSQAWKMKRLHQPWIESETLSISIGQGYDLVTPLQSARMIAMVANKGREVIPTVGKALVEPGGGIERVISSHPGGSFLNQGHLDLIREALTQVVHSGEGTARRLQASPNKIAGKTGTSQVVGRESGLSGGKLKPHGWFVAYAPYDDPKIAVAAIVENAGSGGAFAGPVAMAVIDAYLGNGAPPSSRTE